jgi:glycosyltransferase involved in cell wall biosynthesis
MKTLSIGISTVSIKKTQAINLAENLIKLFKKDFLIEIVVLSQLEEQEIRYNLCNRIKVIHSSKKGLSQSRNDIIEELSGDYIWLLDDDVSVNNRTIDNIFNNCQKNYSHDLIVGKIYCSDKESFFKAYKKRRGYLGVLRTSSIELIINREFIINNALRYNESLGLGSKYPCGEENEFLIRCLNKGASCCFPDDIFILHPSLETLGKSDYFSSKNQVIAKRIVASQLPIHYKILYFFKVTFHLLLKKKDISLTLTFLFNSK